MKKRKLDRANFLIQTTNPILTMQANKVLLCVVLITVLFSIPSEAGSSRCYNPVSAQQMEDSYSYLVSFIEALTHARVAWAELQENLPYDFYLAHGMEKPAYDRDWRIFYPSDLQK